jgi:hypothetical protein
MSKFDAGKHYQYTADDAPSKALVGKNIPDTKRRDPQRTPRVTAARQAAFDQEKLGNVGNGAFCRPGSQNRSK